MKINLEILNSAYIYAPNKIEELKTKELVPKMVTRRRLTRASKIAIFLSNEVSFTKGRVVYGNAYGELDSTAKILNSISVQEQISPTTFQNSVYNTAVSYLSMLNGNKEEIISISSGDKTSLNILKAGAIKALDKDTILLLATETLDIENIDKLNNCIDYLECAIALKVKVTTEDSTLDYMSLQNDEKFPLSMLHMLNIARNISSEKKNIIEVNI